MDVKSAFLNRHRVHIEQLKGFINHVYPNHIYRLKKILFRLKQASRTWYERLNAYLIEHEFIKGQVDRTLFVRNYGKNLLSTQIHLDDIVFSATLDFFSYEFNFERKSKFEMSTIGELCFFFEIQVKQTVDEIFIFQSKDARDLVKKYGMEGKTHARTPMSIIVKIYNDPLLVRVLILLYIKV